VYLNVILKRLDAYSNTVLWVLYLIDTVSECSIWRNTVLWVLYIILRRQGDLWRCTGAQFRNHILGIPYFEYCILFFVGRGETCDVVPVHKFEITSYYFNYFYYFLLYGCIISTSHLFGSLSYFRWTSVFCFFYAIAYMDSWDPSHVQKMVITLHIYVVFSTPYKNKNLDDIFICTVFFSGETKKWDLETFVYMVFLVDILLSVFFVLCMISWEFFFVFRGERRIFSTVFSVP
jgi:hypothetical protein